MKIHYYFGWFNNNIPEQMAQILRNDITERKSLVSICTTPSEHDKNDRFVGEVIAEWFDPAGLRFDEYLLIDYRVAKEKAQELLRNASVILLHGGWPEKQNAFIVEYELAAPVKESTAAVIIGASAGAMNMSAKFASSEASKTVDGLGLDNFAMESHALCDIEELAKSDRVQNELMPLSKNLDVYVACEESTIRVKNGKMDVMGDVYLISDSKIQKVEETDFAKDTPNAETIAVIEEVRAMKKDPSLGKGYTDVDEMMKELL